EAYEVAQETGDRNRVALVLTNLGETYNRLREADKAITVLKQAEELADELGDKLRLAEAVRGLGKAYVSQGELPRARACMARGVHVCGDIQAKVQLGVAPGGLGEVTAAESPTAEALAAAREHVRQSIVIFEQIGNEVELARSCRTYAELLRSAGAKST